MVKFIKCESADVSVDTCWGGHGGWCHRTVVCGEPVLSNTGYHDKQSDTWRRPCTFPPGSAMHVEYGDYIGPRTFSSVVYYNPLLVDCGGMDVVVTPPAVTKLKEKYGKGMPYGGWIHEDAIAKKLAEDRAARHPLAPLAAEMGGYLECEHGELTAYMPLRNELLFLKKSKLWGKPVQTHGVIQGGHPGVPWTAIRIERRVYRTSM